ncbi:MAG: hypothetical protein E6Q34_01360 [Burkholderiaceae bacterium]|nr:MAG: hypothetical protein E6Q34_01360 [Burkholderiaceae bacterium]
MAIANDTSCANLQNRLFVIDQQYVLSEKLGSCSDARYRQTLYGKNPDTVLCSNADSIAGPRFSCSDPALTSLFKQAIANLNLPDLGLGREHQVQQVTVNSKAESSLPITSFGARLFYNSAPSNIVLKDGKLWDQFVAFGKFQAPSKFELDFNQQMVVGTFFKTPNNCSETRIVKLASNGQQLVAQYLERNIVSIASCDTSSNQASTPMNLVATTKLDLPVEFVNISNTMIPNEIIEQSNNSGVKLARSFLIQDQAAWAQLWSEHNDQQAAPNIDFSKKMVVAVFSGVKPNGCYGVSDVHLWRYNGRTNVAVMETAPSPLAICAMYMPSPAVMLSIDKTADPVDMMTIPLAY